MKSPKYPEFSDFTAKLWGLFRTTWVCDMLSHSDTESENHIQLCKPGFRIMIHPDNSKLTQLNIVILTDSLKSAPKSYL